jgi:hypothetical protein
MGIGLLVSIGLWRARQHGLALYLLLITTISLCPMVFLNHVSELYTYNAMPFVALLVGLGAATWQLKTGPKFATLLYAVLAAIAVLNVLAVRSKGSMMVSNGQRAEELAGQLATIAEDPRVHQLILANPHSASREYSVFVMNHFRVLEHGLNIVSQRAHRQDLGILIAEPTEAVVHRGCPGCVVVGLTETGTVVVLDGWPGQ